MNLCYLKMITARERFDVLSAMNVNITVFWSLTPCSLVRGLPVLRINLLSNFPEHGNSWVL